MKKLITSLISATMLFAVSCSESYDDSALVGRVNSLENRIAKLEELCKQMNTNISSLQTIVTALQNNDYITGVTPITKGGETIGYTITFTKSQPITIYHGEDGKDGQNGADGKDGKDGADGYTPIIGVKQDTDGVYYWTLDGYWLLDADGNKIKAQGTDGKDGQNGIDGTDGTTPQLKIENDYWYISYDNGKTWIQLGKAVGDDGFNGLDGDAFFKGVTMGDGYVIFILNDGYDTQIKLPFHSEQALTITISENQKLEELLTSAHMRSILSLKVIGNINEEDLKYISARMLVLETLDLSEAIMEESYKNYMNPWKDVYMNNTIREVILSPSCTVWNIDYMLGLESIKILNGNQEIGDSGSDAQMSYVPYLKDLYYLNGVKSIEGCPLNVRIKTHYYLPSTLESIDNTIFFENNSDTGGFRADAVIILALTPPKMIKDDKGFYTERLHSYYYAKTITDVPLYVPRQSIELYKNSLGWKQFTNIIAIEDSEYKDIIF